MAIHLPDNVAQSFYGATSAYKALDNLYRGLDPNNNTLIYVPLGDLIPDEWAAAKTNGTSAAVSVASGLLTMTTGTDDNGYAGQGFGLFWKGDLGYTSEIITAPGSAITTIKFEIGMTDSTADAGAVNVKATPSATADDFVVLVYDTDDNTQLDVVNQTDGSGVSAAAENVATVTASTMLRAQFRALGDNVGVFVNGSQVVSGGCQGGDLVTPWVFAQARAGAASRTLDTRFVFCVGPYSATRLP